MVMIVVRDAGSNGDEVLGVEVIMNNEKKGNKGMWQNLTQKRNKEK